MNVALLQTDVQWNRPDENERRADALMATRPGCALYVLPEMWNTGFGTAEPDPQAILRMRRLADRHRACVLGSVAWREPGSPLLRNRFVFARPGSAEISIYDKRHLFRYGGEDRHYAPGADRVVVEWGSVRFLLQICYDLRFPAFSRNRGDYDCIVYVASWPQSRIEVWRTLIRARAIENQCYVLGVNRTGSDESGLYCGATAFIDPKGRATECPGAAEQLLEGTIDLASLHTFRQKFPVLEDGDEFTLTPALSLFEGEGGKNVSI